MSEPVENVEIEDVLSSIRRMVTVESDRPRNGDDTADGKLILTPAHRIGDEPKGDGEQATVTAIPVADDSPAGADPADDYTEALERRIAELEATIAANPANATRPDPTAPESSGDPASVNGKVSDGQDNPPRDMWDKGPGDTASDMEILDAETRKADAGREDGQAFPFSDDAAMIDEDALRDMVAEIVRDELQGALGERITRNVRKLVRREIMRAVSIRDFD